MSYKGISIGGSFPHSLLSTSQRYDWSPRDQDDCWGSWMASSGVLDLSKPNKSSLRIQVPSEKVFGVGLEGPSTF